MAKSLIRAVAWDIDGTLIDSEPLHEGVLHEVCGELGDDLSDLPADAFKGVHLHDVWARIAPRFPGVDPAGWAKAIVDRYVARVAAAPPLAGAVKVMRALGKAGIRQVCVSNSGRRIVDANLTAIGVTDLIEFSISLDDVARGKPDPLPYAEAARRLGLPAAQVAAVEDSAVGARSALDAWLRVIGIAPLGGTVPGAAVTVATLDDLPALILPQHAVSTRTA